MGNLFNMDGGLFRFLGRLADLLILNIVFWVTCIPIVTIGAAWTSLYYVTLKMVRNEESYIVRSYFKSFKENFKQSTILWLFILVFIVILIADFQIINAFGGNVLNAVRLMISAIATLVIMVLMYLFPLLAKFYNTIKNTCKNAFLMAVRHLPFTIAMFVISVGSVVLTFFNAWTLNYGLLFWTTLGFATVAFANSWFLVRVFDKYIPKEEETTGTGEV